MMDPRISNLAKTLVQYSTQVKPKDWVIIKADTIALPLVKEVLKEVIQAGAYPDVQLTDSELGELKLKYFNEDQINHVSPAESMAYADADVLINLLATSNTRTMAAIDPARQTMYQKARSELSETYMRRAATGELRWVLTQFPCPAYAQEADMSLTDYEDFVYSATFSDKPDPINEWNRIHDEQQKMIDWLVGKKHVEIKGPNADLTLSIEERTFINSDGKNNMPSGEIFTGPVEESVNGWVRFTYPAITSGREVNGVELHFKDGKVIDASAKKNEDFLIKQLNTDAGASYLGEFAIGTNYGIKKFTKSILFDEKIGGSFHLAVGAGYPETGSKNKSAIHWDFICDTRDDSEIMIDGQLFYKNGAFVI